MCVSVCVSMYVCVRVRVRVFKSEREVHSVDVCIYVRTYVRAHVRTYFCMYVIFNSPIAVSGGSSEDTSGSYSYKEITLRQYVAIDSTICFNLLTIKHYL